MVKKLSIKSAIFFLNIIFLAINHSIIKKKLKYFRFKI